MIIQQICIHVSDKIAQYIVLSYECTQICTQLSVLGFFYMIKNEYKCLDFQLSLLTPGYPNYIGCRHWCLSFLLGSSTLIAMTV